jgi:phage-related protein
MVRHTDLTWYTNTSILGRVDKPLIWLGSSRSALREFPDDARRVAGYQLRRVQQGLEPNDWKAMTIVGVGVKEIRIHTGLEHRVLYLARFAEGVYVLHAFEKRTRTISKRDIDVARERFRALIEKRRNQKPGER